METDLIDPFELPPDEEAVPPPPKGRKRRHATIVLPKTAVLGIRMFPSERRAVNAAARRSGRKEASAWAREVVLAAAANDTLPSLDEGAREELLRLRRDLNSGAGANLNQALLYANREAKMGRAPDKRALLEAVLEAKEALVGLRADLAKFITPRGRR